MAMMIASLLLLLVLADIGNALSLQVPPTSALITKSGKPVARYGLGGAARSTQPSSLPSLYVNELTSTAAAPFLFYYNPHRYPQFMSGIKELTTSAGQGPPREDIFIAGGGTDRTPAGLDQRLDDCLEYSGGAYLDCFVLEYVCPEELAVDVLAPWNPDPTKRLMPHPDLMAAISHVRRWVDEGKVRYCGISTHSHVVGAVLAGVEEVDALMIRYNLAHKDAAEEVTFPAARENSKPVIAFTTTRWNDLQEGGPNAPTTAECLSFALGKQASPPVEAVLHSARDEDELREAMEGIQMGLGEEDETRLRLYGESIEAANEDFFDEYPEERYLKVPSA